MERSYIEKQNEETGKEQYWVEISDGLTALENLDDEMDISKAWETVRI
jgi:hypothetical protein